MSGGRSRQDPPGVSREHKPRRPRSAPTPSADDTPRSMPLGGTGAGGEGAGGRPSRRGPRSDRDRRMTIVNGILAFVVLIVVLQLWLLTATMNHYLAGGTTILLPAALVSAFCLLLNLGLLWYLYRLES